jgi:hypothetical protein
MSTAWIPDTSAKAAIRRGLADADARRTVPLDVAYQDWLSSAQDPDTSKGSGSGLAVSAAIGIGIGFAIVSRLLSRSEPQAHRREQMTAADLAEAVDRSRNRDTAIPN